MADVQFDDDEVPVVETHYTAPPPPPPIAASRGAEEHKSAINPRASGQGPAHQQAADGEVMDLTEESPPPAVAAQSSTSAAAVVIDATMSTDDDEPDERRAKGTKKRKIVAEDDEAADEPIGKDEEKAQQAGAPEEVGDPIEDCPKRCRKPADGGHQPCEILGETLHAIPRYIIHWKGWSHDIDDDDVTEQAMAPWKKSYPAMVAEWEAKKPPELKKKKKDIFSIAPIASLAPQSVTPRASVEKEVATFAQLLAKERKQKTGVIPSLMTRYSADALDASETLISANSAHQERDDEIARRREAQDKFLENLAARHAKPAKKRERKPKATEAKPTAAAGESTPATAAAAAASSALSANADAASVPAAVSASLAAASPTSSAVSSPARPKPKRQKKDADAGPSPAKKKAPKVPDDMEFLMFQEKMLADRARALATKKKMEEEQAAAGGKKSEEQATPRPAADIK